MIIGVYQIRNLVNGKRYIGSVAGQYGLYGRWNKHKSDLVLGRHHSIHLQRAWNKYYAESFVFEILEECEPKLCIKREQYYLDTLLFAYYNDQRFHKLGYNICRVAGSSLGRKLSTEHKHKISIAMSGRKYSKETKEKLSICNSGHRNPMYGRRGEESPRYGMKHSKQVKYQIAMTKRKLTLEQEQEVLCLLGQGLTQRKVGERFNIHQSTVSDIKRGKRRGSIS